MAHQPETIPWADLAELMEPKFYAYGSKDLSKLEYRDDIDESEAVDKTQDFAKRVSQAIYDQAKIDKQQYPQSYPEISDETIVISDQVSRTIAPTIRRLAQAFPWRQTKESQIEWSDDPCYHEDTNACKCTLPLPCRKMKSFNLELKNSDCNEFFSINGADYFQLDIIKTLIIHNEMETVMKISSNSKADWSKWQSFGWCCSEDPDSGWDQLIVPAIHHYVALNLLYCFPNLRRIHVDPDTGINHDYRDLSFYQQLLCNLISEQRDSELCLFPHRDFYGLASKQEDAEIPPATAPSADNDEDDDESDDSDDSDDADSWNKEGFEILSGRGNPEEEVNKPFTVELADANIIVPPSADTVQLVAAIFKQKGLPPEIVTCIFQAAGFLGNSKSTLLIPHEPLHPANDAQLKQYLDLCWQILVNCEVMGSVHALHASNGRGDGLSTVPWQTEVENCVYWRLGLDGN